MGHFETVQRQFIAHLRDPQACPDAGMPAERAKVYESLIYSNIESLLSSGFPVLKGLDTEARWHQRVRAFLKTHRCAPAEFHRAAGCYVDFVFEQSDALPDDWPFLAELVHYEWVEMVLAIAADQVDWVQVEHGAADDDWVLSPLAAVLAYCAPVHAISPGQPVEIAQQPATFLAVRRNRRDAVQFMQLNALTWQLMVWMRDNEGAGINEAIDAFAEALPQLADALRLQAPGLIEHLRDSDVLIPRHALRAYVDCFPESRPEARLPALRLGLMG